jgi:hypothetical protein
LPRSPGAPRPPEPTAPWVEPPRYGGNVLPQRVPADPDVPDVPDEVAHETLGEGPPAEAPELTRIASYLRDEDEEAAPVRPDGFDIPAVLAAVRDVMGVREATLRPHPGGVHTLRLELADDADPGQVSREVARLLKVRMGLAAEPNEAAVRPRSAPPEPVRTVPEPPNHHLRRASSIRSDSAAGSGRLTAYPRGSELGHDAPNAAPPRPLPGGAGGPRVVLDQVEVTTQGNDAVVEVRLTADGAPAFGVASGPAFDGYVLRLAAVAAANAVDELLAEPTGQARARCFVEDATVVPFGNCEVAVVVLLLACAGWVEQLAGSAVVGSDPRHAVVRATLSAVNRRIEALLP